MITKLQLLLILREDVPLAQLEAHLASEGQRVRGSVPRGGRHRRLLRVHDDPTRAGADEHETPATGAFDAVFEIGGEDLDPAALAAAVRGVGTHLEPWIDQARSAAVVGTQVEVVAGIRRFGALYGLRRLPTLSHAQFVDHWSGEHAALVRAISALSGYRQFVADLEQSREAADSAGLGISDFDGVAESFYEDRAAFLSIMADPTVTSGVLDDERRFVDAARSALALYRTAWDAPV